MFNSAAHGWSCDGLIDLATGLGAIYLLLEEVKQQLQRQDRAAPRGIFCG